MGRSKADKISILDIKKGGGAFMPADFTKGTWECNFMPEEFSVKGKGCIITADGKYVASVQNDNDGKLIAEAPKVA